MKYFAHVQLTLILIFHTAHAAAPTPLTPEQIAQQAREKALQSTLQLAVQPLGVPVKQPQQIQKPQQQQSQPVQKKQPQLQKVVTPVQQAPQPSSMQAPQPGPVQPPQPITQPRQPVLQSSKSEVKGHDGQASQPPQQMIPPQFQVQMPTPQQGSVQAPQPSEVQMPALQPSQALITQPQTDTPSPADPKPRPAPQEMKTVPITSGKEDAFAELTRLLPVKKITPNENIPVEQTAAIAQTHKEVTEPAGQQKIDQPEDSFGSSGFFPQEAQTDDEESIVVEEV